MGISRDSMHKRRATGGKQKAWCKKRKFPVGSHVVGAFIMPCGNCFYCVKGQEDLCESFFVYNRAKGTLYDGETRLFLRSNGKPVYMYSMGGLAEYCAVPANALAVLPNSLPYTESAILGWAVFTRYGALRHAAEMCAGDSLAVIGVGRGWIKVKIIGSYGARARQDLPQIVKLAESVAFNLQNAISRKCKFGEANNAYEDLDRGKIVGRAVVEIM